MNTYSESCKKKTFPPLYFKQKTLMTILDLIKAACKTKGVPEKYAERIQKTFKIEKAEGMEAFVDLFKENIFPAIQEAENEAKTTAETAAVAAYEAKHGLKRVNRWKIRIRIRKRKKSC